MHIAKRIARHFTLACLLSLWCARALALDPALDASQYGHTAWKIRDGFTRGIIIAFAQTADGYLWLGTDAGLVRFDGVRNMPWESPDGTALPGNRIRVLLAAHDGSLWIGTWGGLASWNGKKLQIYPRFDGSSVNGLVEDREGTVWVSATFPTTGLICAVRGIKTECKGEDGSLGAVGPALYQTQEGALWADVNSDLWRWRPGGPKHYSLPESTPGGFQDVSEIETGAILVLTLNGIQQITNGKVEPLPIPGLHRDIRPDHMLRDRNGALWIGNFGAGLVHLHQGRADVFDHSDGLSGDRIARLFEDREGNIWVSTAEGLDRFRALPAITYSAKEGPPGAASAVLADNDGSVWFSTIEGLFRWRDGQMFAYRAHTERHLQNDSPAPGESAVTEVVVPGLPERAWAPLYRDRHGRIWFGGGVRSSGFGYIENNRFTALSGIRAGYIDSIAEDSGGNLWIAHRDLGLLRVSPALSVQPVKLSVGVRTGDAWRLTVDPTRGGFWLGLFSGGVTHVADGRIDASYSAKDGLGKGAVNDLRIAADGSIWAATDGGLSRIKNGRIATLTAKSGLPCDAVHSTIEDDEGATWVYTACGLARIARADLNAWAAEADIGKAPSTISAFVLSDADGVRSFATPGSSATPHLTKARDGRLWFITADGVTVVDPRNLHLNTLPPPVHVEAITADRKTYGLASLVHLPPLVRDLRIDFTALSLVAPDKTQFRYKLEGRDRDWQDAGNRRQAFFTDLAPGNYRFHVIASNNSGVWNKEGETLAFSIAPAYWQTSWFLVLCAAALAALAWTAYLVRMRQVAHAAAQTQKVEQRHRELQTELAHANRLATMGQLTASISHEIRQPITSVLSSGFAARRWLDKLDLDEVRQSIERMIKDAARADDVISGLRALVKKAPAQTASFDLNRAIREVIVITHGEAIKNKVSVATQLTDAPPLVQGDKVQLQQVMLNLIVNAIEAMSGVAEGPRDLLIKTAEFEPESVAVTVQDTGPGLDPDNLSRAFEAFYTTKSQGLGMGLSICRSIVEAHGGKLIVAANVPRGAIFQFTLPARAESSLTAQRT